MLFSRRDGPFVAEGRVRGRVCGLPGSLSRARSRQLLPTALSEARGFTVKTSLCRTPISVAAARATRRNAMRRDATRPRVPCCLVRSIYARPP